MAKVIENPVKHLRVTLGMTQARFAENLDRLIKKTNHNSSGFSLRFLQEIEKNRQKIPAEAAEILEMQYGLFPDSLLKEGNKAVTIAGAPLTKEWLEHWKKHRSDQRNRADTINSAFSWQIEAISRAVSEKPLSDLIIITNKISDFLENLCDQHNLRPAIHNYIREELKEAKERRKTSLDELRARFRGMGTWEKFSEKLKANLPSYIEETTFLLWIPQGGVTLYPDHTGNPCVCPVVNRKTYRTDYKIFVEPNYHLELSTYHGEMTIVPPGESKLLTVELN